MSRLEEIELLVKALSPDELRAFRGWFTSASEQACAYRSVRGA